MTVRELIRRSLMLIGVLADGENATASQQSDAFQSLKEMLAAWSTQGLLNFESHIEEFNLIPNQSEYTIGTGGNFNTSRPLIFERATIKDVANNPKVELYLELLTPEQWADIRVKGITSVYPRKMWVNKGAPLSTIHLYPVPEFANKIVLYTKKPYGGFLNVNSTIELPDEYLRALRYNLAGELCPEYGKAIPMEVAKIADDSKKEIKQANHKPIFTRVDGALSNRGGVDIFSGK